MKNFKLAGRAGLISAGMLLVSACATVGDKSASTEFGLANFSADRFRTDVAFLAADEMRGRDTGSAEHRIAANYVAARFARLGIKPAGDDGSYLQEVPMRTGQLDAESAKMSLTVNGESTELKLGEDFLVGGSPKMDMAAAAGDLVFAGFGIHAPAIGHDDLAGLDLDGKVVVAFQGAPASFNTEIRAHHGGNNSKIKELAKRGANGLIIVNTRSREKLRPFKRMARFTSYRAFGWVEKYETDVAGFASGSINHETAGKIFAASGIDFEGLLDGMEKGTYQTAALNASVDMSYKVNRSDMFKSPNVAAVLEGSDPVLKNEYIVLSAHLDHIGVSERARGDDKINNGALDNATGIASMLEVAHQFAETGVRPRRSIIFLAVTGEEKGLLGADYFAHFPTVAKEGLVGNVNLDMPVLLYDFQDVIAFGAERSSIGPVAREALGSQGIGLTPDPLPEQGLFTRSDHYRFVQQGIPSVFLMTGFEDTPDGKNGGEEFKRFLSHDYHSPRDDVHQPIDYQAGAKFAYINWLILNGLANADEKPKWNKGDYFGQVFNGPMAD